MNDRVGIVVIGRNEGERLRACLESVRGERVIYLDSGSSDGSVALAESLGVQTISVDPPFSAARGRNAGLAAIERMTPQPRYVQFIDGDCEMDSAWLCAACDFLDANAATAAVAGILRELHPEASIYNRLCNLEWQAPAGRTTAVGGVALYRAAALAETGPFDPDIVAGEEPQLCLRLRTAGWTLRRIDVPMARHDANLLHFAQWWRRVVRGGAGALDIYFRTNGELFASVVWRAIVWGLVLPLCGLTVFLGGVSDRPLSVAIYGVLTLMALYVVQAIRMARQGVRNGLSMRDGLAFGLLSVLSKFAEMWGLIMHFKRSQRLRTATQSAQCVSPISASRSA